LTRCAADDQGRYSMNGVQVRDPGDGTFCCVSTNGRYLLIARGISLGDERGHLGCPPDRPIVVPTVAWNEAFRKVPQLLDQPRGSNKPKTVKVALEGTKVRLSSNERSFTCDQIDGRFPDWTQVLPKRGPAFTIYVNPDLLVDILTAVKQMIGEQKKVTLAFWTDAEPMAVVAKSAETGLCIDGLVMPLTPSPSQIQKEKDERAARATQEEESNAEPKEEEGSTEESETEEVDA
jgi:DNA polymerase III sliding clamp (beta) subunit (PCNA family)